MPGLATSVVLQMTVELTVATLLDSSGSRKCAALPKSAFALLTTVVPQVAAGSSVPVIVKVTEPFAGSVRSATLRLPAPPASQLAPAVPTQVHVTPPSDTGRVSSSVGESVSVSV